MNYRKLGKLNIDISLLGMGMLRLPLRSHDNSDIDIDQTVKMVRYAIDKGVNYFDTAYMYHGFKSENVLGQALAGEYRQRVYIATKSPSKYIKKEEDWEKFLDEQLLKIHVDYIDFYLQHGLDKKTFDFLESINFWKKAEKAKKNGKIKYFGFSFHDDYATFEYILNKYDWDFCQIQLNYADYNTQAGLRGLSAAKKKGLGVIIMEPLKGGALTVGLPAKVRELIQAYGKEYTPAQWAFKWLAHYPEISVILSGMSNFDQLVQNIEFFSSDKCNVNNMSDSDLNFFKSLADSWDNYFLVKCSDCKYCMPCPNGVDIPVNFRIYNKFSSRTNEALEIAKNEYGFSMYKNKTGADRCISCGICEKNCPQKIKIIETLKKLHSVLKTTKNKNF